MNPRRDLQVAIYNSLTEYLTTPVFSRVPTGQKLPYILIGNFSSSWYPVKSEMMDCVQEIRVRGNNKTEVADIAYSIQTWLPNVHNFLTLEDFQVVLTRIVSTGEETIMGEYEDETTYTLNYRYLLANKKWILEGGIWNDLNIWRDDKLYQD
jgi:hypothetical protein